jgi:16S rRNA (guanine(966)-N(2))-methyltransferase RsmD
VRDNSVRPATDRVKGTIFNVLQSRLRLNGAHVLDLFAGSGSLGFEALSRGAATVVFVDDRRAVLDMIERNGEELGCIDSCILIQSDAEMFIDRTNEKFDLIFADPPYAYEAISALPSKILQRQLLTNEGFLIIEHAKRTIFLPSAKYRIAVEKEFGNTRLSFFQPDPEGSGGDG